MPVKINDPDYNKKYLNTFLRNTERKDNGCWVWLRQKNPITGYGTSSYKGKNMGAHRVSYILFYDQIPNGLVIHHKCENKICVNPEHLVAITQSENLSIAGWHGKHHSSKTNCPYGHEYTLVEEKVHGIQRNHRRCKICEKKRSTQITKKMTMIEYENKIQMEKKLMSDQTFDRTTIIEKGIQIFGRGSFSSAIKLKMFAKGVNVYGKHITYALKWLDRLDIPIEELAREMNFTTKTTKLRKKITS